MRITLKQLKQMINEEVKRASLKEQAINFTLGARRSPPAGIRSESFRGIEITVTFERGGLRNTLEVYNQLAQAAGEVSGGNWQVQSPREQARVSGGEDAANVTIMFNRGYVYDENEVNDAMRQLKDRYNAAGAPRGAPQIQRILLNRIL